MSYSNLIFLKMIIRFIDREWLLYKLFGVIDTKSKVHKSEIKI